MPVSTTAFAKHMQCAHRSMALMAAACLGIVGSAHAQSAKVYVANSSNTRVSSVQFDPNSTTIVIEDPNLLTQVRDLAIRDNGLNGSSLILCDRNGGRVAFYQNSSGAGQLIYDKAQNAGPERPDGMSLDLAGNLFVMNSGQGSSGGVSQVWVLPRDPGCPNPSRPDCRPGGYRVPLGKIDADARIYTQFGGSPVALMAELLPESIVAKSGGGAFQAGDLLVIANPGALIRYRGPQIAAFLTALAAGQTPAQLVPDTVIHPAGASVPADRQFPAGGSQPSGLAFGPNGELLITISDGRVLIYNADGSRRSNGAGGYVDFTSGDGQQDQFKIAVGLQDGKNRAFVTHQSRGELHRYSFNTNGTGTLDSVVGGFQFPVGVDISNSATIAAPAGSNVNVAPTSVLASRIENVLTPGLVNARVSTFPDPREAEQATPPNLPLHRSLFLNELRADLPHIEIPAYARAFRLGDPNTGTPTFILIEADSNLVVTGVLDHHAIEAPILGYDPSCTDPEPTKQPFLFWSPDANDAPIVEGAKFIDITTGCGSIRGWSRDMSYFLAGVRITEPVKDLVRQKLDALRLVCNSTCISNQTARKLAQSLDRADREFERARYSTIADILQSMENLVLQTPQAFTGCTTNVSGDIRARVHSAIYAVGKLP